MVSVLKAVKTVRKTFKNVGSQAAAFVDPWSYKRAQPDEKAALDQGLQDLREKLAEYKGPENTDEAAAPSPDAEETSAFDDFHKKQVIKHVEKYLSQVEAFKAGTGSMDMPLSIVTRNVKDLTEEVTNLANGQRKLVVPLVISDELSTKISDKISSGLTGLTAALQRKADAMKQKP